MNIFSKLAAPVVGAGLALGALAMAGGAASAATVTPGVTTTVVLDNGGYKQCLNDKGGSHAAGTPVVLYTCSTAANNQWTAFPDNTLRPAGDTNVALADVSGKAVLEPVGGTGQDWYVRADGSIISGLSVPGSSILKLNDPGFNAANGTQLVVFNETAATGTNEHWYLPKARYATSKLSARPDSGNGGNNWANDAMTRGSMVLYTGDASTGVHSYQGSVYDNGTFYGVAGTLTPNQGGAYATVTQADSTTGQIAGFANYLFTSSAFVSSAPGSAYSGSQPSTGSWPALFFASGAVTDGGLQNSGPVAWHWGYGQTSNDNCSVKETWVDGAANSSGNVTGAGNIFGGSGTGGSNASCATITAAARPSIYGD